MLDSGFALPAATFLLTLSYTRQIPALRSGMSVESAQGNDDEKFNIELGFYMVLLEDCQRILYNK